MKIFNQIADKVSDNKKYQYCLFLTVLIILASLMVHFYSPLQPGHDFFFHFRRFEVLIDAIRSGSFPIYMDTTAIEGYGYLTKIFYPDFILIPFAVVGMFTNTVFAYQFMIWTMTILCGIYTYKAIAVIYKNNFAAFAGAILYTFAFYRLLDIYQRAALGEALSFTFLPIVLRGMYEIIKGDYKKWYKLAIGFTLLIFTHLISSILSAVICLIFVIIYNKSLRKQPKRILYLFLSAAVTLIFTAYYLYPLIEQMWSGSFYYQTHKIIGFFTLGFKTNWIIWGFFAGIVQPRQIMTVGTGIILTLVLCTRIFIRGKSVKLRSADIMAITGLVFIGLTTGILGRLWDHYPLSLLEFIQFPWRLYEFSTLFFAIAGGYYLSVLIKSRKRILVCSAMLCIATIFMMISDGKLYHSIRSNRSITEPANFENNYHLGGYEYIPSNVPSLEFLHKRGENHIQKLYDTNLVQAISKNNGVLSFDIYKYTEEDEILELPLLYYKGYQAILNGQAIPVRESNNGLVDVLIHQSGRAQVYYKGTIVQAVSFYITIFGMFGFGVYIFLTKYRLRKKKKNEPV